MRLAQFNDDKYGVVSEFINKDDKIIFAYTKIFNNKFIYEFVDETVNDYLMEKYLVYENWY